MNSTDPIKPTEPVEPIDSGGEASDAPGKELMVIDNPNVDEAPEPFAWFWRLLGHKRGSGPSVREGLADALARDTTDSGGFTAEEKAMLASVLRLKDIRVEDLMVPRTDIEAVEVDTTLAEMLLIFEAEGIRACRFMMKPSMILRAWCIFAMWLPILPKRRDCHVRRRQNARPNYPLIWI